MIHECCAAGFFFIYYGLGVGFWSDSYLFINVRIA